MRAMFAAPAAAVLALMLIGFGGASAGEVQPSATASQSATVIGESTPDPCDQGETSGVGEEDPCASASSTAPVPDPTATMTPTLEYEIDVPVSFFPTETTEPSGEETVAAATKTGDDGSPVVTALPNAGGAGPMDRGGNWIVMLAVVAAVASLGLAARAGRAARH